MRPDPARPHSAEWEGMALEEMRPRAARGPGFYAVLRRVHLWLTVATAGPLLVLSLTGAFLVYGEAIQSLVDGAPAPAGPGGLTFGRAFERLAEQAPGISPWSIAPGRAPGEPWSVWLAKGAGVARLDATTGDLIARHDPHATLHGTVVALHRWLLVDGPARGWVRHAISATTLVLIVQVALGLWLWWLPPTRWRNLRPDLRRPARSIVLRLHQLAGVVTAPLLVVIAFTGISMHWTVPTRALVEVVAGDVVMADASGDHAGLPSLTDLDAAVRLAADAVPGGVVRWMRVPRWPGDPAQVGIETSDTTTPSRVTVGGAPPRVLAVRDGRRASGATWFWELRYRLHMGELAGGALRPLWLVLSLTPAAFVVSGLWLWLRRGTASAIRRRTTAG